MTTQQSMSGPPATSAEPVSGPVAGPVAVEVRRSTYRDSVALLGISRTVGRLPAVDAALVAMGTDLNLELLAEMGGVAPADVTANDLLIAVRATEESDRQAALVRATEELAAMTGGPGGGGRTTASDEPQRSMRGAVAHTVTSANPATVALVATPGAAAAVPAFEALHAGLDVMVFSDNVPLQHELALKRTAQQLDLLVMGPDCGTAVLGGAGLGFANTVQSGPVGIVAASGTGAQHLMCLLDAAGVGTSHCLGVGGRDLSAEVGGISTLRALRLLDEDPATERIVVVSKPPAPEVAEQVRATLAELATPTHTALLGEGQPDLTETATQVISALERPPVSWPRWLPPDPPAPRVGMLRGLFCGGTLAEEALLIAEKQLGPIATTEHGHGHRILDMGADDRTAGRPHPMIDPSPRTSQLAAELRSEDCAVVLLDVLLGHGSHPDPAREIVEALQAARALAAVPPVVVTLCGTGADPQDLSAQAQQLREAGAEVYASNAVAARRATELAAQLTTQPAAQPADGPWAKP